MVIRRLEAAFAESFVEVVGAGSFYKFRLQECFLETRVLSGDRRQRSKDQNSCSYELITFVRSRATGAYNCNFFISMPVSTLFAYKPRSSA